MQRRAFFLTLFIAFFLQPVSLAHEAVRLMWSRIPFGETVFLNLTHQDGSQRTIPEFLNAVQTHFGKNLEIFILSTTTNDTNPDLVLFEQSHIKKLDKEALTEYKKQKQAYEKIFKKLSISKHIVVTAPNRPIMPIKTYEIKTSPPPAKWKYLFNGYNQNRSSKYRLLIPNVASINRYTLYKSTIELFLKKTLYKENVSPNYEQAQSAYQKFIENRNNSPIPGSMQTHVWGLKHLAFIDESLTYRLDTVWFLIEHNQKFKFQTSHLLTIIKTIQAVGFELGRDLALLRDTIHQSIRPLGQHPHQQSHMGQQCANMKAQFISFYQSMTEKHKAVEAWSKEVHQKLND